MFCPFEYQQQPVNVNSLLNLLHQQQIQPQYYVRQPQVKPRVIKKLETEDEFQIHIFKPYGNYNNYEVKIVRLGNDNLVKIVLFSKNDQFKVDFKFNLDYIDIENINWKWYKSDNILCLNIPKRIHYVHNDLNDILSCLIETCNTPSYEKVVSLEDHEQLLKQAADAIDGNVSKASRKEQKKLAKQADEEKSAKEKAEKKALAKEEAEKDKLAKEQVEKERLAKEQAEQERLAREKAEKERLAKEQAEQEKLAREKAEKERLAKEQAEKERLAREQAEQERLAKLKLIEELKKQELEKINRSKRQIELLEQQLQQVDEKATPSPSSTSNESKKHKPSNDSPKDFSKQQQDFIQHFFNLKDGAPKVFSIPIKTPSIPKFPSQESIHSDTDDEPATPSPKAESNLKRHPSLEEVEDEEFIMYRKKFGH